ncbi:MAG: TM0106 family RecB-like putative nuclease [Acidimicrobiales bacterium]
MEEMTETLLTPSKISAWLECAHSMTLRRLQERGSLTPLPSVAGDLAELLIEKGMSHEDACLRSFEAQGRDVVRVPPRQPAEAFADWVERVAPLWHDGHDVLYQMPLLSGGIRGIADFVVQVPGEPGAYEPVDAKLTRAAARPGHVLQLCFYAEAIQAVVGIAPRQMHLWLGSGAIETLPVDQFSPYWRRLRRQVSRHLLDEGGDATAPEQCAHCAICEFAPVCEAEWRRNDSLVWVASLGVAERHTLEHAGVTRLGELAARDRGPALAPERWHRHHRQAVLQVSSRERPQEQPPFELIERSDDPFYGRGLELLPAPDDGDVFFDFEGHPFWTPQAELLFLAGMSYWTDPGGWHYEARWAHDLDEQREMLDGVVDFFRERRSRFPGMHVYHYNHTERSAIERFVVGTPTEAVFDQLVRTGLFVDLYTVVRNAVRAGVESYGLKAMEKLTGFERQGGIERGAGAVVEYEQYVRTRNPHILEGIARYNRDDVDATRSLRQWLITLRPPDMAWRPAVLATEEEGAVDEAVRILGGYPTGSVERLVGDLTGYWRRERSATTTPKFAAASAGLDVLLGDPDYLAALRAVGAPEPVPVRGRPDALRHRVTVTWPEQPLDEAFSARGSVLLVFDDGEPGYGSIADMDGDLRTATIRWTPSSADDVRVPVVAIRDDYFPPRDKAVALAELAHLLAFPTPDETVNPVAAELLAARPPRFVAGGGPPTGEFRDDVAEILAWSTELDGSYVAIQGPPGTGKTYRGARLVAHLLESGLRVGVTAMSHAAIDNLLGAAQRELKKQGALDAVRAVRWGGDTSKRLDGVVYTSSKRELIESNAMNLVAGSPWLWARSGMRPYPVDVLIIDEAGQLALADAVACTSGARNLILLGDPLQLAQVAQADHPGDAGSSVLAHVLGPHATIPTSAGVFLTESRRMHPDVCRYISHQIYEDRLTSHPACARQTTVLGTGLRWIRVTHTDRSTSSPEEATAISQAVGQLVGTPWTDHEGRRRLLVPSDFMVVAPFNDQVRTIRDHLGADGLGEVQVGTVDKFQGREAPVVFFSMTTSSAADLVRGAEFLFSRHRLNVAISRARCLAVVVSTEELLEMRARSTEEMHLIATLNAFVEDALEWHPAQPPA